MLHGPLTEWLKVLNQLVVSVNHLKMEFKDSSSCNICVGRYGDLVFHEPKTLYCHHVICRAYAEVIWHQINF